jgi:methylated-DNA-protein-cysteine methyltransferase-like protein
MSRPSSTSWNDSPNGLTQERIYTVTRQIPAGQVSTYGDIAAIVGNCTARMVGYAMAAVTSTSNVPWHRVINAQGRISPRSGGGGEEVQRLRLVDEGILFNNDGKVIDLKRVRWLGPSTEWRVANGFDPSPIWREK